MMKKIILYCAIFKVGILLSQSNHIEYHKVARHIESQILDSLYGDAVQGYVSLFSNYDFVFAEDCFRAAQTALSANDTINTFVFLERGVCQGITKKRILSDSILIDLVLSNKWKTFEMNYDSLRTLYRNKINWDLRDKINELHDLDQKYRDKHQLHPWNFLWRPIIWMKWKRTTKNIVENELIPLIIKYGFPNEKLIGLDEVSHHQKQKQDHLMSNYAFTILIHYFSVPRPADLNTILFSSLKAGSISPRQYASLIDFQAEWGKGKYYQGLHYNEWHTSENKSEFETIDMNRLKIGLESLAQKEKIYKRGLAACKKRKVGDYRHIRFWVFCG